MTVADGARRVARDQSRVDACAVAERRARWNGGSELHIPVVPVITAHERSDVPVNFFGGLDMLRRCALLGLLALIPGTRVVAAEPASAPQFQSSFLRVVLAPDQPAFTVLAVDSLGQKKLTKNPLRAPTKSAGAYELRQIGQRFEYHSAAVPSAPPVWTFEFSERRIKLTSSYSAENPPPPILLNINPHISRGTLLGLFNDDGAIRLPALLHFPNLGTFRITSIPAQGMAVGYDALRHPDVKAQVTDFVKVNLPPATASIKSVSYIFDVVDIYPPLPGIANDPRFDGFRRDWLDMFQLAPRFRALANHAASDVCAFTVFEYSAMALRTPPLAAGLTALDMIRQTLDRYLSGMKAYGLPGYTPNDPSIPFAYADTYPSLIMAVSDYVHGSNDQVWLKKNYAGVKDWATTMLATDHGSGLIEYPLSGNSGIWDKKFSTHAANWWDNVGFGHYDAYSNALAYQALLDMADLAGRANQPGDAKLYAARAEKLRSVYYDTFYDPATGVLAGWKSSDGQLHDYYFTFVNGMAITYGLIPPDKANKLMDRLLAKMKEVGFTHFEYGLPGNLIPIRRDDYLESRQEWGGGTKADGSDGFQIYENGGATACFAYFTIEALKKLGREKEADAILFPMLRSFADGGFQGSAPNGRSYDWKTWDGKPFGYEGLLVDGYMTLLAVLPK